MGMIVLLNEWCKLNVFCIGECHHIGLYIRATEGKGLRGERCEYKLTKM